MAFTKITDTELASRGATTLPNQPSISATALKQEFDAPAKQIVAPAVNRLVDELEATSAAGNIGMVTPTGRTGNTVQTVVNYLSTRLKDCEDHMVYANPEEEATDVLTKLEVEGTVYVVSGSGGGDYSVLINKPSIENVTLSGNKSLDDLGIVNNVQANWSQSDSGEEDYIKNKPTLGTAAALDVATSGDASTTEVVKGDDSRLTDARTPTSHVHTKSQITDFPTFGTAAAKDYTDTVDAGDHRLLESGGAYNAIDGAFSNAVPKYSHDNTQWDTTPTASSTKPVTSGGEYNTALGEYQLVKDTVGWSGKNVNSAEYKNYELNGVTWTVNSDGSVKANGTTDSSSTSQNGLSSTNPLYNCTPWVCKKTGQYIANGCSNANDKISMYLWSDEDNARPYTDSSKTTRVSGDIYNNQDVSFYAEAGKNYHLILRVKVNTQADNFVFYPMIRHADILDPTYEPYHAPVSQQKADNSVIAPVEDGDKYSSTYSAGKRFIRGGKFCKTIVGVTSADAPTLNTNYVEEPDVATALDGYVKYRGVINSSHNLNNITDFGVYTITTLPTNAPSDGAYSSLRVLPLSSSGIIQEITKNYKVWRRGYTGTPATWTNWYVFAGTEIVP